MLSACSGNSLTPKSNYKISVSSKPSGAGVYAMGKRLGVTPVDVDNHSVFPVVYLPETENSYGHVTLTHEGCIDKKVKISAQIISNGLNAELDCSLEKDTVIEGAGPVEKSVKQRLKQLQELKDEGLISDQEYQKIRRSILNLLY